MSPPVTPHLPLEVKSKAMRALNGGAYNTTWTRLALGLSALLVFPGQTPAPDACEGALFREVAASSGLDFTHSNGMTGEFYFPEIVPGGAAWLDYDNDGDLDAYLVQSGPLGPEVVNTDLRWADRLFRNQLAETGTLSFVDVTEASRIRAFGYGMGVAAADVDNDGWVDLYVTNFGPNQLWRNRGDGTFEDATASSGTGDPLWGTSAAFFDYDRDGWLDLFVANYVLFDFHRNWKCYAPSSARDYCGPGSFDPAPDRLFRNRGDGTFQDVTLTAGLSDAFGPGLGVVTADFDQDGWIDVYVANDGAANQLWMNQGDGRFRDEALLAGAALNRMGRAEAGMGVDAADFDGDGDDDLFMTHLNQETNTLYLNDGQGTFEDRSVETRLATPSFAYTGFGAGFFDYDNDGWLDLLAVNGAVRLLEEQTSRGDPFPFAQPNQLFRNQGDGTFVEVSGEAGAAFELSEVSRGAAFGDVDNDGDLDVLVTQDHGRARLLHNCTGSRRQWLGVRLLDERGRDALGARLELETAGKRTLQRRVRSDGSYCSSNDPRVLFGLGEEGSRARLRVVWPDGGREQWEGLQSGRYHVLRRGQGAKIETETNLKSTFRDESR